MAITYVQEAQGQFFDPFGFTVVATLSSPVAAGDGIVVVTYDAPASSGFVTGITDTGSNVYTNVYTHTFSNNMRITYWVAQNTTLQSTLTVTPTVSATGGFGEGVGWFNVVQYATQGQPLTLDQTALIDGVSGPSASIGPVTITAANEVLVSALIVNTTSSGATATAPFNLRGTFANAGRVFTAGAGVSDEEVTSTGSYSAGWGTFGAGNQGYGTLVTFYAAPPTYSISGNTGHAAITAVAYTGTASGSVNTDASGNYTISGLSNGSYVITPTLSGYAFTPATQNETVSGSNITGVNFTAALSAYSVPDDRTYATFPNNAVDVQGTQTYTVNAHPSHAAPVDSRTSDPVDSRTAANIPENSRTQPK